MPRRIRGYVSSDDDEYGDFDLGYSDPLVITEKEEFPPLPVIHNPKLREVLLNAREESRLLKKLANAGDKGDLATIEELLSQGVHVDAAAPKEWTVLLKACGQGNSEMVRFLLERGSDPNKHKESVTPLMACCTHTLVSEDLKLACVRLLLENGAKVNAKDKYGTTALMYAAGSGYTDIVTELLAVPGIDVNMQDSEGWTALFYAANLNHIAIVEKILPKEPNLTLQDTYERTVIDLAVDREFMKLAKILGYVEEVIPPAPPISREKLLSTWFLDELPDSNGEGGFFVDAKCAITAFDHLEVENVSLPELLTATTEDMNEFGVTLEPDQLSLALDVHWFHLQPWEKSSMNEIVEQQPLKLEKIIAISGSAVKHLTVINASLRYLDARISSRMNEDVDLYVQKELIIILVNAYTVAEKLNVLLPKIMSHAQKMKLVLPADFIYPQAKESHWKKAKLFWCALGAGAAAVLLIRHHRINPYVRAVVSAFPFIKAFKIV